MRMFLTVERYFSESKKGFDLRLVRLVLDSVFRSSPGASGQFRIAHSRSFRFTRLLLLCVGAVLILVTSVAIDTSIVHLGSHSATRLMLLFVTSSEFLTVRTLFFISATCFSST